MVVAFENKTVYQLAQVEVALSPSRGSFVCVQKFTILVNIYYL